MPDVSPPRYSVTGTNERKTKKAALKERRFRTVLSADRENEQAVHLWQADWARLQQQPPPDTSQVIVVGEHTGI